MRRQYLRHNTRFPRRLRSIQPHKPYARRRMYESADVMMPCSEILNRMQELADSIARKCHVYIDWGSGDEWQTPDASDTPGADAWAFGAYSISGDEDCIDNFRASFINEVQGNAVTQWRANYPDAEVEYPYYEDTGLAKLWLYFDAPEG